jgi:hypothetical protein
MASTLAMSASALVFSLGADNTATKAAVLAWQQTHPALKQDGDYGPASAAQMQKDLAPNPAPPAHYAAKGAPAGPAAETVNQRRLAAKTSGAAGAGASMRSQASVAASGTGASLWDQVSTAISSAWDSAFTGEVPVGAVKPKGKSWLWWVGGTVAGAAFVGGWPGAVVGFVGGKVIGVVYSKMRRQW